MLGVHWTCVLCLWVLDCHNGESAPVLLNLNNSIWCACKDSTQNSSKIPDKISARSSCRKSEKLGFPDVVKTPCKNC